MLEVGSIVDRYVIESVLGEGGMGIVYRARDTRLDRRVALKVVRTERLAAEADREKAIERLLREARAAAAFHHPNTVAIYDVGAVDGMPFLAMELVTGRTLRALIGDQSVPWRQRAHWLIDVAKALESAHKAGLVHRDVKPENVMLSEEGHVKVLDFGIARRSTSPADPNAQTQAQLGTLTAEGVAIGTPFYMAPEQIKGDPIDARADQFSWGVLAYELLSGKLPWRTNAETLGAVASILTETPKRLDDVDPSISPAVADLVARCLSKSASDRLPSMGDVARALEQALEGVVSVPEPRQSERPRGRVSSRAPAPPPTPAQDARRWSEDEMKQILERAMSEPEPRPGIGYETMVAAAREVGIAESAIERATRAEETADMVRFNAGEWHAQQKRKFFRHALTFGIIQIPLFFLMGWDARWVSMWWGFALALQGVRTFFGDPPDQEKWERRQNRRKAKRQEKPTKRIEQAVSELLSTAERLALRDLANPPKVRVATPPARVLQGDDRRLTPEDESSADEAERRGRR